MAVAHETGLMVGQAVSQDRRLETWRALADTLPPAQRDAPDGHGACAELVWPEGGQHILSVGKDETYTIESLNANLRKYLKRLARRQRCFSRSLEAWHSTPLLLEGDFSSALLVPLSRQLVAGEPCHLNM